uniref:Uncharacterized protein n=1 Tax=uncultured prokaryote TaxID=198431 RepID=H5S8T5_9ZZZZ|nr:hypothetical protein HGMM_F01F09C11 [uncultured prokaryote]
MHSRRPVRQHRHRPRRAQLWFLVSLLTVLLALSPLAVVALERLDPATPGLPDKTAEPIPPIAVSPVGQPEGTSGSDCLSGKIACPPSEETAEPAPPKDPEKPEPILPKDPGTPTDPHMPKEAKFSITVIKEWSGGDPPADAIDDLLTLDVVLNGGSATMTSTCSWNGSALVQAGTGESCTLSLGAELDTTILQLQESGLSDNWIGELTSPNRGRLPVSMTLAELVQNGSCTQQDEAYYECTLKVTNVARPMVQCGDRDIPYPETGTYYCLDWRKLWTRNGQLAPAPLGDYQVTITVELGNTVLGTMSCDKEGCTPLSTWLDLAALGVTEEVLGDLTFTIEENGLPSEWTLHPSLQDGATFNELRDPQLAPFVPDQCVISISRDSQARVVSCLVYIVNSGPTNERPGDPGGSGGSGGTGGSSGPGGSSGSSGSAGSAPQGSPSAPSTAPPVPADQGVPGSSSAPAPQPPASQAAGASAGPGTPAPAGAAQPPSGLPQVLPRTGAGTGTLSPFVFPLLGLAGLVLLAAGVTHSVRERRSR